MTSEVLLCHKCSSVASLLAGALTGESGDALNAIETAAQKLRPCLAEMNLLSTWRHLSSSGITPPDKECRVRVQPALMLDASCRPDRGPGCCTPGGDSFAAHHHADPAPSGQAVICFSLASRKLVLYDLQTGLITTCFQYLSPSCPHQALRSLQALPSAVRMTGGEPLLARLFSDFRDRHAYLRSILQAKFPLSSWLSLYATD